MKHFLTILALAVLPLCSLPAAERGIAEFPTLTGSQVAPSTDSLLMIDASASNPQGRKITFSELANVSGLFAASSHTHSLSNLTQSGATTGQVPTWNGSAWAAATPSTATVDNAAVNSAIATSANTTRAHVMGANSNFNFILVGDSIMAGVTTGGATAPHYLSAVLPSKSYFSGRATIINKGVSGRTTTQILSDWQTGANTDPYAYRPSNQGGTRAVVLVTAGINDWNNASSMTTALSNMTTYVSNLKSAGFEVWLGIPLPASNGGNADYTTRTGMKAYIRGLRSLTTPDKKIDFNQLVHNMTGTGTGSIWTGDSLHPNNALYDTMADLINLKAWGDDGLASGVDLGTLAFQDSDTASFDGVANFYTNPRRYAATGTTAGIELQVAGAGSNKKVKIEHTSVTNGNVPANGLVMSIWNGSAWETMGWGQGGDVNQPRTITAAGTTGAQTINKPLGRVNFASGATSLVVTNSLVTASSVITVSKATNDSTARLGAVVPTSGSFTIYMDVAPAAECAVNFDVKNSAN